MSVLRMLATALVFGAACIAWMILGGVTVARQSETSSVLDERVGDLWGSPQVQAPPGLTFRWSAWRDAVSERTENGKRVVTKERVLDHFDKVVPLASTRIGAELRSDIRRKGLLWYSLYDVDFAGTWRYVHGEPSAGELDIAFKLPDAGAVYDDLTFVVDGHDYTSSLTPQDGVLRVSVPVQPDEVRDIAIGYRSRGRDSWAYAPTSGVGVLKDFRMTLTTDFQDYDFLAQSLSPSQKHLTEAGAALEWSFSHVVTGHRLGISTPQRLQPGELVSELSFSAPISLLFFFVIMFVLATLRRIDLHPMNYLFIAAAFFAFHLLFAYTADRLPLPWAFALASAVSVFLVVSYLRLVVSTTFAYREAALAQLLYLVGFSLAHFWEGFTGLTVTVLAIVTLYVVMQLTGRVRWSELVLPSAHPATR